MNGQLTSDERAICTALGVEPQDYVNTRSGGTATPAVLTAEELAVCTAIGVDPTAYLETRDAEVTGVGGGCLVAARAIGGQPSTTQAGIAACTFEIEAADAEVQLTPTGRFRATDGRPRGVPAGWLIDGEIAERVIARTAARANDLVIDYEHQTLQTERNGQPAPAAGWAPRSALHWREGQGLFAGLVRWTPAARARIEAKEYRYASAVFRYDGTTGEVLEVLQIALTNNPAIDGLANVTATAAAFA